MTKKEFIVRQSVNISLMCALFTVFYGAYKASDWGNTIIFGTLISITYTHILADSIIRRKSKENGIS